MEKRLASLKNTALNKTWVSFLHDNHPYSLLHWSVGGIGHEKKDVWLIQDELTFETTEFPTIDDALKWMQENMKNIHDVLG